jgi:RHS repeat-associated protein
MVYDEDNRLVQYKAADGTKTVTFTYDWEGNRAKKVLSTTANQQTTTTTSMYIGSIYEKEGTIERNYYYLGTKRIATKIINGSTLYFHSDHLGSTNITTGDQGMVAGITEYRPFGETIKDTNMSTDYKYTGKELDTETGLYYYGARYYDPVLARFISADSIVPSASNPQNLNRYSYTLNNPLKYIDPTGHSTESAFNEMVSQLIRIPGTAILGVGSGFIAGKELIKGDVGAAYTVAKTGFDSSLNYWQTGDINSTGEKIIEGGVNYVVDKSVNRITSGIQKGTYVRQYTNKFGDVTTVGIFDRNELGQFASYQKIPYGQYVLSKLISANTLKNIVIDKAGEKAVEAITPMITDMVVDTLDQTDDGVCMMASGPTSNAYCGSMPSGSPSSSGADALENPSGGGGGISIGISDGAPVSSGGGGSSSSGGVTAIAGDVQYMIVTGMYK